MPDISSVQVSQGYHATNSKQTPPLFPKDFNNVKEAEEMRLKELERLEGLEKQRNDLKTESDKAQAYINKLNKDLVDAEDRAAKEKQESDSEIDRLRQILSATESSVVALKKEKETLESSLKDCQKLTIKVLDDRNNFPPQYSMTAVYIVCMQSRLALTRQDIYSQKNATLRWDKFAMSPSQAIYLRNGQQDSNERPVQCSWWAFQPDDSIIDGVTSYMISPEGTGSMYAGFVEGVPGNVLKWTLLLQSGVSRKLGSWFIESDGLGQWRFAIRSLVLDASQPGPVILAERKDSNTQRFAILAVNLPWKSLFL